MRHPDASRRRFLRMGAGLAAGGLVLAPAGAPAGEEEAPSEEGAPTSFKVFPVGTVEKKDETAGIRIFEKYRDALLGLDGWSHVNVLYWLDRNDTPRKRGILKVHPRGNRENPETGVFACRAPFRPNLIALSVCRIEAVEDGVVRVDRIDAFDGTPVLDLKPLIPPDVPSQGLRVPDWARRRR